MREIKDIAIEVAELVEKKNADYDKAFEKSLIKYGMTSYCIRLEDKLNRAFAVGVKNIHNVNDESLMDTIKDIVGYSLLALQHYENTKALEDK